MIWIAGFLIQLINPINLEVSDNPNGSHWQPDQVTASVSTGAGNIHIDVPGEPLQNFPPNEIGELCY